MVSLLRRRIDFPGFVRAADPYPTAKLGLRPQTVAPSGAASANKTTENQANLRKRDTVLFSCVLVTNVLKKLPS